MDSAKKSTSKFNKEAGASVMQMQGPPSAVPTVSKESESTELLFRNSRSFTNNPPGTATGYGSSSDSETENEQGHMSRIASGTLCHESQLNNNLGHGNEKFPSGSDSSEVIGFPLGSTHARTALLVPSKSGHIGKLA